MDIPLDSIPIIVAVIDENGNFTFFNKLLMEQNELFLKLNQENIKNDFKDIISKDQNDLNIILDNKIMNFDLKKVKIKNNTIIFLNNTNDNYLYKFISNISYNMRTELTGIFGNIFFLFETKLTKEQYSYLDIIKESAHELIKMINDVIDFLKLTNGSIKLNNQKFNIKECVEFIKKIMNVPFKNNNTKLTIRIDDSVPEYITSDQDRIKQLIVNLLYSSIKSYKTNGWIHVDIYYSNQNLLIKIKDGRSKNETKILNDFFQKNDIKSNEESLQAEIDFELLLCKYIIVFLGGEIFIDDLNTINIKINVIHDVDNKKQINNQNVGIYKIKDVKLKTEIYIFLLDNNLIPIFFSDIDELELFMSKKPLSYLITNNEYFTELKDKDLSVYNILDDSDFKKDLVDFIN